MIIRRYLLRETLLSCFVVTLVLLFLFMSGTFVKVLSETVDGAYPARLMYALLGLRTVSTLVFLLPLGLFLGVLVALGRLYKDSEMVVLYACGLHPDTVVRIVGAMSLVVAAMVAELSFQLAPMAEAASQRLFDQLEASPEIEGIVAGRFNQTDDGRRLIYVQEMSADRTRLMNIFVHSRDAARLELLTAARGREVRDPATHQRYLDLEDGWRYVGVPGRNDYQIMKFEHHGILLTERPIKSTSRRRSATPTTDLMASADRGEKAELHWRIAMPIGTLLLGLFAVPFSRTSPRQGRYGKVFLGFLVYVLYNNLLTAGRGWLESGKLNPAFGLWWVHLLMLAGVVLALRWNRGSPLLPWRGRAAA